MSCVGQIWAYEVEDQRVDVYLIVADNEDSSYQMINLETSEFFVRVQLPEHSHRTYWRRVT
jgi:hypothetical protein